MTWLHLSDTTPRAREQYRCELCGLRIRKGARHVARRGIDSDGGGHVTYRMHAVCESRTRGWDLTDWEVADDQWDFRRCSLDLPLLKEAGK